MSKEKGDIQIGQRAFEELLRLFPSIGTAVTRSGCSKNAIYTWKAGSTPDGLNLARLHYAGADVIYILTGKRTGV